MRREDDEDSVVVRFADEAAEGADELPTDRDDEDDPSGPEEEAEFAVEGPVDVVDTDTLRMAQEALARVGSVLGSPTVEKSYDDQDDPLIQVDLAALSRRLRRGWNDVIAEVRALSSTPERSERLASLIDVLDMVHTAEGAVGSGLTLRGSPVSRVRERIQWLDTIGSLEDMVDHTPAAAAGLGFDRVLLSRVEESTWLPVRLYFKGDMQWASEVLEALSEEPLSLNTSLLETQMVRRAVPLRVVNPANRPLMHRTMIELSHTPGYIAAPIVDSGNVVGFIHADCYYQERIPDQGDVETLWLFTQALGPMLARQGLAERLTTLRQDIESPVSLMGTGKPRASTSQKSSSHRPGAPRAGQEPRPVPPPNGVVTAREIDVLRLLSEGASNEQIARRLVISIGTVKSHVKRILRKLDAANRAEAVSLWLRSEYHQMSNADQH